MLWQVILGVIKKSMPRFVINQLRVDVKTCLMWFSNLIWTSITSRYIYKITDFGAARELKQREDSFMSIYGTEEYLVSGLKELLFLDIKSKFPLDIQNIGRPIVSQIMVLKDDSKNLRPILKTSSDKFQWKCRKVI